MKTKLVHDSSYCLGWSVKSAYGPVYTNICLMVYTNPHVTVAPLEASWAVFVDLQRPQVNSAEIGASQQALPRRYEPFLQLLGQGLHQHVVIGAKSCRRACN